jgi:hypothetical protein
VRFSLKTLLATVSVAAVVCCVFFALPYWLSFIILGLFWFLVPPALIAAIVYCRGYGRAFAIGCVSAGGCLPIVYLYLLVSLFSSIDLPTDDNGAMVVKIALAAFSVVVGLSGLTGVGVRWLSLRSAKNAEAPRKPLPAEYSVLQGRVSTVPVESTSAAIEPQTDASVPSS